VVEGGKTDWVDHAVGVVRTGGLATQEKRRTGGRAKKTAEGKSSRRAERGVERKDVVRGKEKNRANSRTKDEGVAIMTKHSSRPRNHGSPFPTQKQQGGGAQGEREIL